MIAFTRIDSRLLHGQVLMAWVPHLNVKRIVVADDTSAGSPLEAAAMQLAVPQGIELQVLSVNNVPWQKLEEDSVRTLVLLRDVQSLKAASGHGLARHPVNLGNLHSAPGKKPLSPSVFVSEEELSSLQALDASGYPVSIQSVPKDPARELASALPH